MYEKYKLSGCIVTGGNVVRGDQKLCKRSPYESVQIRVTG